jgi:hypothetical protein
MPQSYPKSDWDCFDELQITVEHLELSQTLLRSRSHSKARAAVILLDHVADVLMYRICVHDFERQEMIEKVMPPDVPAKARAEILFRFDKKVSYLAQTKRVISNVDAAVLLVGHRVRNFAYHRDYHNPSTISVLGRILYKSLCQVLPLLAEHGEHRFGSGHERLAWTKLYGITADWANYVEVVNRISKALDKRIKIDLAKAASLLKKHLLFRYDSIWNTLNVWFSFQSDKELDVMLKQCEFLDVRAEEMRAIWQPLKEARYLVHDLHKHVPIEDWPHLEVPPEKRREIRRALLLAERTFKNSRRSALRKFQQTVSARTLRYLKRNISQLPTAQSLQQLISRYEPLERDIARVESYVAHAEAAAELASDVARGK